MNLKTLLGAATLACGLAVTLPASATLTLQTGLVGGSGDVDNVIFNACGLGSSSGTTVQGCLNTSDTTRVNFTSNETLTIGGGGQAVIAAMDGFFSTVTIALGQCLHRFRQAAVQPRRCGRWLGQLLGCGPVRHSV
jgi:hypothetical protein